MGESLTLIRRPAKLFGLEDKNAIGKRLDERVRGLDWESLTRSGGPRQSRHGNFLSCESFY